MLIVSQFKKWTISALVLSSFASVAFAGDNIWRPTPPAMTQLPAAVMQGYAPPPQLAMPTPVFRQARVDPVYQMAQYAISPPRMQATPPGYYPYSYSPAMAYTAPSMYQYPTAAYVQPLPAMPMPISMPVSNYYPAPRQQQQFTTQFVPVQTPVKQQKIVEKKPVFQRQYAWRPAVDHTIVKKPQKQVKLNQIESRWVTPTVQANPYSPNPSYINRPSFNRPHYSMQRYNQPQPYAMPAIQQMPPIRIIQPSQRSQSQMRFTPPQMRRPPVYSNQSWRPVPGIRMMPSYSNYPVSQAAVGNHQVIQNEIAPYTNDDFRSGAVYRSREQFEEIPAPIVEDLSNWWSSDEKNWWASCTRCAG